MAEVAELTFEGSRNKTTCLGWPVGPCTPAHRPPPVAVAHRHSQRRQQFFGRSSNGTGTPSSIQIPHPTLTTSTPEPVVASRGSRLAPARIRNSLPSSKATGNTTTTAIMSFGGQTPTIIVLKEGESCPTAIPPRYLAASRLQCFVSPAAHHLERSLWLTSVYRG